jgi:ABC-2 type transport system permease protein
VFVLGTLAFFVTRTMALTNLYFALFSLFSGYLLPLPLLPGWIADIAAASPFRYMLSVPVELMTRSLERAEIAKMLLGQLGWATAALAGALWIWRRGVRHFEAVGG